MKKTLFITACWLLLTNSLSADTQCSNENISQGNTDSIHLLPEETTRISSDYLLFDGSSSFKLEGNVNVLDADKQLFSNQARYDKAAQTITASGAIRFQTTDLTVLGEQAELNLERETFTIDSASYQYTTTVQTAQGRAQRVMRTGYGVLKLTDATYSSCPPENESWRIEASEVNLDTAAQAGSAKHIKLYFQDTPFFYFPWFGFPLGDQRKTGFLAPSVGYSTRHGADIAAPWYWNIAPTADATFIPRYLEDRGLHLDTELRHLNQAGLWALNTGYIDDNEQSQERKFARLRQTGQFGSRWETAIDASYASDQDYFDDFGDEFSNSDIEHLPRRASLKYQGDHTDFSLLAQGHQTLDPDTPITDRPYRQLPKINLNAYSDRDTDTLQYRINTEWTRFDRDESVTGDRVLLQPRLSWPHKQPGWFVIPSTSLWHSQYQLDNQMSGIEASPSVTTPVFSLDSGLFFDRNLKNGGLHTLEPRLYYLFAAHEDQNDIPDFDTSLNSFGFNQLFRENRFSGYDRMGDANQIALALTTRVLSPLGQEQLTLSLGRLFYLRDRKVTLPEDAIETSEMSSLAFQGFYHVAPQWRLENDLLWDPKTERTELSSASLRYQNKQNDSRFWLAHRYRPEETERDEIEQLEAEFLWPVTGRLSLSAKALYAVRSRETIDQMAGVQYDSCCWALRLSARKKIDENNEEQEAYYLEWVLKGLTSLGESAGRLFE